MKREPFVDFFLVEPHQADMHKRLENWAKWCYGPSGSSASPMFRLYRPDNWERGEPSIPVDHSDATKIAKGVALLPAPNREALQWNYVTGGSPTGARKRLGVTSQGLMQLIRDGRQMLMNRAV